MNMISTVACMTDMTVDEKIAESVLYDLWFSVAEMIFEKVCEVTQLDDEQKEALRNKWQSITPEQKQKLRERYKNMTPDERKAARERLMRFRQNQTQ